MASSAVGNNTAPGTNTMIAGIAFQMLTISVFVFFFCNFLYRSRHATLPRAVKLLTIATVISVIFIYIRSVYRVVELSQGWNGYLISHEPYFIALDGMLLIPCPLAPPCLFFIYFSN
jgi:hypothetical protein